MKFWKSLLETHHPNVHDLATHLESSVNELPAVTAKLAPVEIAAMFGIDDREWQLVIKALHVDRELSLIGSSFPRVYITRHVLEDDGLDTRLCLSSNSQLRDGLLESWLGCHVSEIDQLHLSHALRLLPDGWYIVLDPRESS